MYDDDDAPADGRSLEAEDGLFYAISLLLNAAATILCGACGLRHHSVSMVRACHAAGGQTWRCDWLVEVRGEDSMLAYPCGAVAWDTGRGFTCTAGHEHVTDEARRTEGWEYAEDEGEARALVGAGVEPRTMLGQVWI